MPLHLLGIPNSTLPLTNRGNPVFTRTLPISKFGYVHMDLMRL